MRIRIISLLTAFVMLLSLFLLAGCTKTDRKTKKETETAEVSDEVGTDDTDNGNDETKNDEGEPSDITPMLWRVTSDDSAGELYLFGTIHVGAKDMYPLPDYIAEAYDACDKLAVELDLKKNDIAGMTDILKKFLYTDGSRIDEHIEQNTYRDAVALLKDCNMYFPVFDSYRPSLWALFLSSAIAQSGSYDPDYGVDMYLTEMAKKDGHELIELEGEELQYKLFYEMSDELAEFVMAETCREYNECGDADELLAEQLDTWCRGDEEKMNNEEYDTSEYSGYELALTEQYIKILLTDRNQAMAGKAAEFLSAGDKCFFAVGAAHMLGESGVPALLSGMGYNVERINP